MNTVSKFSENYFSNIFLVTIASGVHLFPSRTQKLSHLTPTIVNAKIGSCQEFFLCKKDYYYSNNSSFFYPKTPIPSHTTYTEEETIELAQNIESEKFPNMVICLEGDLGTGKTVFTKGFAKAMEIDEEVTSPTFNIIKEYTSGEMPLYHMDVYRLDGKMNGLDIEEYYTKKGVTIIEWADMIPDLLPDKRLDIKFRSSSEDEDKRIITLIPHGKKYEEVCEAVV